MPDLPTAPVNSLQHFKGIAFPAGIRFRQILVTGPPGAGKSRMIARLGGWSEEGYLDIGRKNWWRSRVPVVAGWVLIVEFIFCLFTFTRELLSVRSKMLLSLIFCGLAALLSAFLDAPPARFASGTGDPRWPRRPVGQAHPRAIRPSLRLR